jgi:hypothetical protein
LHDPELCAIITAISYRGVIHTKKLTAAALAAIMALSLCIPAFADGITTYSDKSVAFIESFEGYMQYQYEDPVGSGNYYIGYGTNCAKDAYPDGVTKAEAEQMLRDYLDKSVVARAQQLPLRKFCFSHPAAVRRSGNFSPTISAAHG